MLYTRQELSFTKTVLYTVCYVDLNKNMKNKRSSHDTIPIIPMCHTSTEQNLFMLSQIQNAIDS